MASSRKPFKTTLHNFRYAFRGIGILFRDERNAWIHLTAAVIVTVLGFLLGLSRLEWMIVVGVIAAVIAAEAFNSALERLCDRVSLEHHPLIGQAKDLAAGAVLLTAIGSGYCRFIGVCTQNLCLFPMRWIVMVVGLWGLTLSLHAQSYHKGVRISGDVLAAGLPVAALVTTLIERDYQVRNNWSFRGFRPPP